MFTPTRIKKVRREEERQKIRERAFPSCQTFGGKRFTSRVLAQTAEGVDLPDCARFWTRLVGNDDHFGEKYRLVRDLLVF